ncbi:MAG TPA: septum formation inhibitor Maf [Halothiobacillus sp.]|nr:septum formation inhibitor Maf [Halothiobacillus sp.]
MTLLSSPTNARDSSCTKQLVLGSSSPFRRELLKRLGLAFECHSPKIDESRLPGESPRDLVRRLAEAKAKAVARHYPAAWVIGSDQVAVIDEQILGKPGTLEKACQQLAQASGRSVIFLTGLCLIAPDGVIQTDVIPFTVHFRSLSELEIQRYVEREQPLNCAGSFKSEGLGITLLEAMEGDDPTALIGLPLIRLSAMLRESGLDPLMTSS